MRHSSISMPGASFLFSKRKKGAGTRLPPVEDGGTCTRLLLVRPLDSLRCTPDDGIEPDVQRLCVPSSSHKKADDSSPYAGAGAHTEAAKLAGEGPAMPVLCERERDRERAALSSLPALPAMPQPVHQPVLSQPGLSLSPSQGGGVLGLRALVGRQPQPHSKPPTPEKAGRSFFDQAAAPEQAHGSKRPRSGALP